MSGYIKIYRQTCDHPLFKRDMAYLGAWTWLLMNVAWKPHKTKHRKTITYEIARGQMPGSRKHIAEAIGWSEKKVRIFLAALEAEGMIELGSLKGQRLTIITVCNYRKYQDEREARGQERAEKGPRKGHTEERKEVKEDNNTATSSTSFPAREQPEPMPAAPGGVDLENLATMLHQAGGAALNRSRGATESMSDPLMWIEQGADVKFDIIPAIRDLARGKRPNSISSWNYFASAVMDRRDRRCRFRQAPVSPGVAVRSPIEEMYEALNAEH